MDFIQTYYFFIASAAAFCAAAVYCFLATANGLWPRGLILPVLAGAAMAQSIYLPIPGSDILLIEAVAVCTMGGSVFGMSMRMFLRSLRRRRAERFA